MIEFEKTYLAKYIPVDLNNYPSKTITDRYIPVDSNHPVLRLRNSGGKFTLTKKYPVRDGDASSQIEETIILSEKEARVLEKIEAKAVSKTRFYYNYCDNPLEIDVFKEELSGLIMIDAEFNSEEEKNKSKMPEFCLVDVTQETILAGGILCGKKYDDIKDILDKYGYKKIDSNA